MALVATEWREARLNGARSDSMAPIKGRVANQIAAFASILV